MAVGTDAERLAEAKNLLRSLANGEHPFEHTRLSENDVTNDVRVVRGLFSVLELLEREERLPGADAPKRKTAPADFFLTEEREAFDFSSDPLPVTKVTERINGTVRDASRRKLQYKEVTGWLVEKGLMEIVTLETGWKRVPTEAGRALGIRVEHRRAIDREYDVVLYTEEMQHFLLDHIDEIALFAAERRKRKKDEKKREAAKPAEPFSDLLDE